jgi:hypothetical protein
MTYVVFSENQIAYHFYRPMAYLDGFLIGMNFHIGDHRDPDGNLDGAWK